ncbi:hypothetical protein GCM10019814_01680 [Lactococcus raffinolactis]
MTLLYYTLREDTVNRHGNDRKMSNFSSVFILVDGHLRDFYSLYEDRHYSKAVFSIKYDKI